MQMKPVRQPSRDLREKKENFGGPAAAGPKGEGRCFSEEAVLVVSLVTGREERQSGIPNIGDCLSNAHGYRKLRQSPREERTRREEDGWRGRGSGETNQEV